MKKSNEARSSIMELLPREIIIIILSKLPVSSFMQCKLVCKYWRLLVQDNHLFCKHPGLFLQSYYPIKNQLYFARQSIIYQIPLPATLPEFNLVGSSNSFLCFNNSQDTSSIYVYNFCTGVYIVLPEPRKYDEETSTLGFGMDPITKQHKVVRIVCYNSEALLPSSTTSDVQIFSIGSTAWRSLGNVGYSVRNPMQVLVNENLHGLTWALKNGLETRTRIVSFDLANEQLRMVPFVQVAEFDDRPQHFYSLVALGKCLSVAIGKGSGNIFEIWVMKEYGVVESWILAYSFGFDVPRNDPFFVRVLGLLNNGEILLEYNSRSLISYDPNLNAFTPYELTNNLSFVFVTVVHMGCHWLG